jgi:hypothetical protein
MNVERERTVMMLLRILVGIGLLVIGRRLFLLFVGLMGFITGIHLASHFFPGQPEWMIIVIGLMAGVLGALLALLLQWMAVGLAGFLAGGYIVVSVLHVLGSGIRMDWLPFLIGGILGTILIIFLFDWALIILSSLAGAGLITETSHVDHWVKTLLFIVLLIAGIVVQSGLMKRRQSPATTLDRK